MNPTRGFCSMLVGRWVTTDVDRGTFNVSVDADKRVWKNNQSQAPKSLRGKRVNSKGIPLQFSDAVVATRMGETIRFGAPHDGGDSLRVGDVLRKVAPVEKRDSPGLYEDFRCFNGGL